MRSPIVAVDFDGTITLRNNFPEICNELNYVVIDFLRQAHELGCINILWSCRWGKTLNEARKICEENCIPIDYYNENAPYVDLKSPKIFADYYIDDKSYNIDKDFLQHILEHIKESTFQEWINIKDLKDYYGEE